MQISESQPIESFYSRCLGRWKTLTKLQKNLIIIIIFLAISLAFLIALTVFLIIRKDIRLAHCSKHGTRRPIRTAPRRLEEYSQRRMYKNILNDTTTTIDAELAIIKKFIVSIHYQFRDEREWAFCVGSIIAPYWFITSSICMHQQLKLENVYVRAGSVYHSRGGYRHKVVNFTLPDWRSGTIDYYTYRYISAVRVGTQFRIDGVNIIAAKLPQQAETTPASFHPNYRLYTAGWGTDTSFKVRPKYENLRPFAAQMYDATRICRNYLQMDEVLALQIYENVLCAGDAKADSKDQCNIDVGAPLTHWGTIYGVSWSGMSCRNYPTVYSKVSLYVNWTWAAISDNNTPKRGFKKPM